MIVRRKIRIIIEEGEVPIVTAYSHTRNVALHQDTLEEGFSVEFVPCKNHITAVSELLATLENRYKEQNREKQDEVEVDSGL